MSPPPYVPWIASGVTGKSPELVTPPTNKLPLLSSAGAAAALSSSPLPPRSDEKRSRPRRSSWTMARSRPPALKGWNASFVVGKSVEAGAPTMSASPSSSTRSDGLDPSASLPPK